MILPFKPQFVEPILNGSKIHTIRADKHQRWQKGKKIHFATGVRTKNYNQFLEGECISTQQIEIVRVSDSMNDTIVKIDGRKLTEPEIQQLAWNDGFSNTVAFWLWFADGFNGRIIHWTDFRY